MLKTKTAQKIDKYLPPKLRRTRRRCAVRSVLNERWAEYKTARRQQEYFVEIIMTGIRTQKVAHPNRIYFYLHDPSMIHTLPHETAEAIVREKLIERFDSEFWL